MLLMAVNEDTPSFKIEINTFQTEAGDPSMNRGPNWTSGLFSRFILYDCQLRKV